MPHQCPAGVRGVALGWKPRAEADAALGQPFRASLLDPRPQHPPASPDSTATSVVLQAVCSGLQRVMFLHKEMGVGCLHVKHLGASPG